MLFIFIQVALFDVTRNKNVKDVTQFLNLF